MNWDQIDEFGGMVADQLDAMPIARTLGYLEGVAMGQPLSVLGFDRAMPKKGVRMRKQKQHNRRLTGRRSRTLQPLVVARKGEQNEG